MSAGLRTFLAVLCFAPATLAADGWQIKYSYDDNFSSLFINDFQFRSPHLGIAVGYVEEKKKIKPMSLRTTDGGAHWSLVPLKEEGLAVFFVDDRRGWLVTPNGLSQSEDGGTTWRRLKAPKDILRVYFTTPERGWAVGDQKHVYQTDDGGREWTDLPAAAQATGNPAYSAYTWIEFADPTHGMITGATTPPRRSGRNFPDWMEPDQAPNRRQWPTVSLELETGDGGGTWKPSSASIFGEITRVRLSRSGRGLAILEFRDAFRWPSEVYRLDLKSGQSTRSFAAKNRLITDAAIPTRGDAYLAGIEPAGKVPHSPVPGKVKILKSGDLSEWIEMDVDYKATANRVFLSTVDGQDVWAATDTGMILKMP